MPIDITHVVSFVSRESFLEKVVQTLYEILDLAFIKKVNLDELKSNIENWISAWDSSVDWDSEGNHSDDYHEWVDSISEKLIAIRQAILDTQKIFGIDNVSGAKEKSSAKIEFDET